MKKKSPTFFAKKILFTAMLCGIAGCSSLPHVFGDDEVPDGAKNAPRLVETPTPARAADQTWPRLGDVPSQPNDFSSLPVVEQSMTDMENARAAAAISRAQSGIAATPQKASNTSNTGPQGF